MIKNITSYLLAGLLLISFALTGCKDDDSGPDGPVVVNRFYPVSGGVGTEILITGKNFGEDVSQVSVTVGGKPLTVLGCNNTGIMAVVSKKLGSGLLQVKIGQNEVVTGVQEFTYTFSAAVSTLAGNGKAGYADGQGPDAQFAFQDDASNWRKGSICIDNDLNIYVGDVVNCCIRKITPDGTVTTLAGKPGLSGNTDGLGQAARFREMYGMGCDNEGNIYVIDVAEWSIRKVTPEGEVTTIGHTGFEPWSVGVDKRDGTLYITNPNGNGGIWQRKPDGTMTQVVFNTAIADVVVDPQGNLYATEFTNNMVARYEAGTWTRTVIAGSSSGYQDGPLSSAQFANPWGIALDPNGDIYIAGNGIWDGGANADQSIRRIDLEGGVVRTVAGSATAGYVDANGVSAAFNAPLDLAIDKNGMIYVFDRKNHSVRKIIYE